jgi:hypothetical protein
MGAGFALAYLECFPADRMIHRTQYLLEIGRLAYGAIDVRNQHDQK